MKKQKQFFWEVAQVVPEQQKKKEKEEEFTEFTAESNNSQTLDDVIDSKSIDINNALAALLESNRLMQAKLSQRETKRRKVYVPMPEKFNGRVGDFIEAWLEQFKTWFHHRANGQVANGFC